VGIEVNNINKNFGNFVALDNVSLNFPSGELTALLGPSGCGKTTLLRIIAGLEHADSGQVLLEGEDASASHVRERQVGFVFQHYALFKHMTVFENIAFGLRVKPRATRPPEAVIQDKVHKLLNLVQLDWLHDRYPAQLSGGQRQRRRVHWQLIRACCCWMNHSAHWMPRCARNCGAGCGDCTMNCTSPASLSPMIRKKRWKLPIRWC
jgi:sulfate transport system ATP-binding protein